jgi:single-strand DNA-binding protein
MNSFNNFTVVGNIGREPNLRYTEKGTAVCDFTLAQNRPTKKTANGNKDQDPLWFKVTIWGNRAETAAQYLKKGDPVYIQGKFDVDHWTDKEGNLRQTLLVNEANFEFMSSSQNGKDEVGQTANTSGDGSVISDNDIPF